MRTVSASGLEGIARRGAQVKLGGRTMNAGMSMFDRPAPQVESAPAPAPAAPDLEAVLERFGDKLASVIAAAPLRVPADPPDPMPVLPPAPQPAPAPQQPPVDRFAIEADGRGLMERVVAMSGGEARYAFRIHRGPKHSIIDVTVEPA